MMSEPSTTATEEQELAALRAEGWSAPLPAVMPAPTYWPAVFGVALAFLAGGLATYLLLSAVGLALLAVAIAGWTYELALEYRGQRGERRHG